MGLEEQRSTAWDLKGLGPPKLEFAWRMGMGENRNRQGSDKGSSFVLHAVRISKLCQKLLLLEMDAHSLGLHHPLQGSILLFSIAAFTLSMHLSYHL